MHRAAERARARRLTARGARGCRLPAAPRTPLLDTCAR